MSVEKILKKQMDKSNGKARIIEVSRNRRPTAKSLIDFQRDVASQTNNFLFAVRLSQK